MSISRAEYELRRRFCRAFLSLGNPAEAAVRAGCPPDSADDQALQMLQLPSCRAYLQSLVRQPPVSLQNLVIAGLSRLAFGSVNDAVKLAFSESCPDEDTLKSLDLFAVSEIKCEKGGVAIKLFDRQKALEKLLECVGSADADAAANALLSALSAASDAVSSDSEEPDS